MDQYDINNLSDGFQANMHHEPTSSEYEEDIIGNMSPLSDDKNSGHQHVSSETHIPNLLDLDDQFGETSDIPHEDPHPVVQNGASLLEKQDDDFDFEKKLPEIPQENPRNESEQMKFSPTHFQDDEVAAEECEEDQHSPQLENKQEEYLNADVEDKEIVEPEQEANHWKPQEKVPETVLPNSEEISTSSQSQRSPSPVFVEEQPMHESNEMLSKSPVSPAEKSLSSPSISQPESKAPQVQPTISAEPFKTRSVKSTKSEGSGRSFLGRWFDLSRLNARVVDLVYWRDPRKSGIVLGAVLAILLSLSVVSVVSVISYSALAVLIGTLSFRLYKNVLQAVQKTQDGHPFKEYLEKDVTVTSEKVHEVADITAAKLNATLLELRRLFLVEDLVDSVKFALILWAFTYVGSWFNGLTLVILGVVGLFSLPKVYETHQEKIDQNVDIVRGKINEIVDKVQAVLPIGKKAKSQ